MVETRPTMDPHSRNVVRMGYDSHGRRTETRIGMIQWHPQREPQIVLDVLPTTFLPTITLAEADVLLAELKERIRESRQTPATAA